MAVQTRYLGQPYLYAITETGPQNSFVHIWAYKSAEDRSARRAAMQADPNGSPISSRAPRRATWSRRKTGYSWRRPFFSLFRRKVC
jgi:hypothetical protein